MELKYSISRNLLAPEEGLMFPVSDNHVELKRKHTFSSQSCLFSVKRREKCRRRVRTRSHSQIRSISYLSGYYDRRSSRRLRLDPTLQSTGSPTPPATHGSLTELPLSSSSPTSLPLSAAKTPRTDRFSVRFSRFPATFRLPLPPFRGLL